MNDNIKFLLISVLFLCKVHASQERVIKNIDTFVGCYHAILQSLPDEEDKRSILLNEYVFQLTWFPGIDYSLNEDSCLEIQESSEVDFEGLSKFLSNKYSAASAKYGVLLKEYFDASAAMWLSYKSDQNKELFFNNYFSKIEKILARHGIEPLVEDVI